MNTSDGREKTPLTAVPDSVRRAVRRIIAQVGVFLWREAVARKGEDQARLHVGGTAQKVRDVFVAEGEDPARWALFCEDAIEERSDAAGEPVTRLGVRTDQLM
ncbi:MAG: tail fiber domain-containing protein [Caulobacterales bacterium]